MDKFQSKLERDINSQHFLLRFPVFLKLFSITQRTANYIDSPALDCSSLTNNAHRDMCYQLFDSH